jgi:hypothetical protein
VRSVASPRRRLDKGSHGYVVGDGRVAVVDEVARGRLEADSAAADDQISKFDVVLQCATRPDTDEAGPVRDRQDLCDHDLDVVGPDPGRDDGYAPAPVGAGHRGELSVAPGQLHV